MSVTSFLFVYINNIIKGKVKERMSQLEDQETTISSEKILKKKDIFYDQIEKHDYSKAVKILNLIYSITIGIVGSVVTKKYFKRGETIGIIMGIASFIVSKKALRTG